MSLATHGFDLPIMPGSISPVLNLSQYDDARTFVAHLKDEDGSPFTLPTGATAKLEGMNCKGVTFEINATPSGSDITFTPMAAATDQPGLIAATLHIKNGNENISTLAVLLNVQKAGATKEEQARSPGFTDAIQNAVNAYFDGDPPFFELPSGGQSGQALLSDGADGAVWGEAGIPEAVKTALLACFENAAWINQNGLNLYNDLRDALDESSVTPPTPEPDLPSGYTRYDYLTKGENVKDAVNTGLFHSPSFAVLDCTFEFLTTSADQNEQGFGARITSPNTAGTGNYSWFFGSGAAEYGIAVRGHLFGSNSQVDVGTFQSGVVRHVEYKWNNGSPTISVDNGTPVSVPNVPSTITPQNTLPLYLCGLNNGDTAGNATPLASTGLSKWGRVTFYDPQTGNKVYDFVSCNNGTKFGYYDLVNQVFYGSIKNLITGGNWS